MTIHPTNTHAKLEPRVEDHALVTGAGRFADDVAAPNQAYAHFVRSPHAFARIGAIDVEAARRAPGVVAVLTGQGDGGGRCRAGLAPSAAGGTQRRRARQCRRGRCLASERVMHVGEAVAVVVAESRRAAQDAAELVAVDYEPLAPVVDIARGGRSRARRSSGRRRPATSRSNGPMPTDEDGDCQRRTDHRWPLRMSRASRSSTSGWSSPRWRRAARPRATTRPRTPTRCAPASKAPTRLREQIVAIMGLPARAARASSARTSAARSG